MDHKSFIASLSDEDRRSLHQRSDINGLLHLAVHLSAIAASATLIASDLPGTMAATLPLGILLVFLFTLQHECVHETPFRTVWLNRLIGAVCGFVLINPNLWFRYFHLAHHRHTHDPTRDPELATPKPQTVGDYLIYLSGLPYWFAATKTLILLVLGSFRAEHLPANARARVIAAARWQFLFYVAVAACSFWFRSDLLVFLWIIPVLIGQPFLRVYLLAEHTLCPHVSNMLENTRTTFTNQLVRFLAWNMPYHAEHHAMPMVPFHRLPALHEKLREHLKQTEPGYAAFHSKMYKRVSSDPPQPNT
ncbi:MAG: fatty acid desaturase [Pseudomonadota bacterium]